MPKRQQSSAPHEIVPRGLIEERILIIRGEKVMLDRHLAELYEVPTKRLNEAVKRNIGDFRQTSCFS
jgi:hypothetical protein